jgi:hypothetical protein
VQRSGGYASLQRLDGSGPLIVCNVRSGADMDPTVSRTFLEERLQAKVEEIADLKAEVKRLQQSRMLSLDTAGASGDTVTISALELAAMKKDLAVRSWQRLRNIGTTCASRKPFVDKLAGASPVQCLSTPLPLPALRVALRRSPWPLEPAGCRLSGREEAGPGE